MEHKTLHFQVTSEIDTRIVDNSEKLGINKSGFIRLCLLEKMKKLEAGSEE